MSQGKFSNTCYFWYTFSDPSDWTVVNHVFSHTHRSRLTLDEHITSTGHHLSTVGTDSQDSDSNSTLVGRGTPKDFTKFWELRRHVNIPLSRPGKWELGMTIDDMSLATHHLYLHFLKASFFKYCKIFLSVFFVGPEHLVIYSHPNY